MSRFFSRRQARIKTHQEAWDEQVTSQRPKACPKCGQESGASEWHAGGQVCPRCGWHASIGAYYRLSLLLDSGSFQELGADLRPSDPLDFPGYRGKLDKAVLQTGMQEAAVSCFGSIDGRRAVFAALDSSFLMGSMGSAVGEIIARAAETAEKKKLPLIIFSASGGARMQEGIVSLMQMAKTAAAVQRFQSAGGLFISVLTHPTMGGVTASFASLGDIMLAEPGALIGFAGPRVIEQTMHEVLPEGFQRAESLLEHGFLDQVVPRPQLRDTLSQLLSLHERGGRRRH